MKKLMMIIVAIMLATTAFGQTKIMVLEKCLLYPRPDMNAINVRLVNAGTILILGEKTGTFYNVTYNDRTYYLVDVQMAKCRIIDDPKAIGSNTNKPIIIYDSLVDLRDGKIYKTVKIGEQIWMADNLAYLPSVSPSDKGSDVNSHYYVYDNEGADVNLAKSLESYSNYGVLYNWPAAAKSCPTGWHLPSDKEWQKLETVLGMSPSEVGQYGLHISGFVSKQLKSEKGWRDGTNGDNSSGLNVLPAGSRYNGQGIAFSNYKAEGGFKYLHELAYFWTATSSSDGVTAFARSLSYKHSGVYYESFSTAEGSSVRCIKDN